MADKLVEAEEAARAHVRAAAMAATPKGEEEDQELAQMQEASAVQQAALRARSPVQHPPGFGTTTMTTTTTTTVTRDPRSGLTRDAKGYLRHNKDSETYTASDAGAPAGEPPFSRAVVPPPPIRSYAQLRGPVDDSHREGYTGDELLSRLQNKSDDFLDRLGQAERRDTASQQQMTTAITPVGGPSRGGKIERECGMCGICAVCVQPRDTVKLSLTVKERQQPG